MIALRPFFFFGACQGKSNLKIDKLEKKLRFLKIFSFSSSFRLRQKQIKIKDITVWTHTEVKRISGCSRAEVIKLNLFSAAKLFALE